MSSITRRLFLEGAAAAAAAVALAGPARAEGTAQHELARRELAQRDEAQQDVLEEGARAMPEPIEIIPGVYTGADGAVETGLCAAFDNADGAWQVTRSGQATVIRIKHGTGWDADAYTDPRTGRRTLRVIREGATLDTVEQRFLHPTPHRTPDEYPSRGEHTERGWPELKIFYTGPGR